MNAQQILARLFVGAVAATTAACASGASSVPVVPSAGAASHMASKSKTYQWVTGSNDAVQYNYPKSTSPIGSIAGLDGPGGECTTGKSTFWIVNSGSGKIAEYTFDGKKQLKTLTFTAEPISSCTVSAKNGDIAAVGFSSEVVVFKGGKQSGATTYELSGKPYFAGYDAKGNLFIDGFSAAYNVAVVELAAGSKTFQSVSLPNTVQFPGSVQWDGKYVAVTDQITSDVYRYAVAGYTASLHGTVALTGASDCGATWIAQTYLFCADAGKNVVSVYSYPSGGTSIATLGDSQSSFGIVQVTK